MYREEFVLACRESLINIPQQLFVSNRISFNMSIYSHIGSNRAAIISSRILTMILHVKSGLINIDPVIFFISQ